METEEQVHAITFPVLIRKAEGGAKTDQLSHPKDSAIRPPFLTSQESETHM